MVNVGYNFGKKYQCRLCYDGDDDQQHLIQCIRLKIKNPFIAEDINYNDIFEANEETQGHIGKIMLKLYRSRIEIIQVNNNQSLDNS